MRFAAAVGILAFAFLSVSPASAAEPARLSLLPIKVPPLATPVPRHQLASCRFAPCNCRYECITWDQNGNCVRTYRTCDTCSICDD